MIEQTDILLDARPRGYHVITHEIEQALGPLPDKGLLHVHIHHTSAGLTVNENADPSVRVDFETFMNHIAPENTLPMQHTLEGDDDMPAHIKSSLVGSSVTVPIKNASLYMGTWQGIYLCEFRNMGGGRRLTLTVYY